MLPEPELPAPLAPPAPAPAPLLPAPDPLGVPPPRPLPPEVVAPLPDVPPLLAPPLPPLVMRSSSKHLSRSRPVMARHLLLMPPLVLPALPLALGDEPMLPPGAELVLDAPEEELLPLIPLDEDPEVCAVETLASAKSAAAVAALRIFSVMSVLPP